MFEIFKAVILGIIEGVTEFLPISSTGHLILANQFISFSENFTQKFDVIIQLGAILAVTIIYWKSLLPNKDNPLPKFTKIWSKIMVAVIPALIFGAIFHDLIEKYLFNPLTVAISLIFWGAVILVVESKEIKIKFDTLSKMNYKSSFIIGLAQCIGMIPGTSRSAMTIIGARLLGASRVTAVEFSFFLAIPTMIAASAFSVYKMGFDVNKLEIAILVTGFITSFLVAWAAIRFFINFISKKDFKIFGYYRIVLGVVVLLYFLITNR
jgi:undecaprenyl-diphosphatase